MAKPLIVGMLFLFGSAAGVADDRPNVAVIVADDQSYRDFGFAGNDLVSTPHLDRLAARSARYPNGYVPTSVCRPSLATLLTGLYPHQHGVHFNHPPPGLREMRTRSAAEYRRLRANAEYLVRDVPTLPRILARHGYACLQTGKHWEGDYRNAGFTHGMTRAEPADDRDWVHGTRQQENGEWVAHGNGDAGLAIGRETMQPIVDFLDDHAGERPVLVWYAPFLPHTPFDAPPRFREPYADRDVPPHLLPYYAEIARFDETVGRLLGELEGRELLESTLIVLVSDNGFRPDRERHERQDDRSKLSPFEDGLRTPILLRWDGTIEPAEHTELVRTVDLVPTILAAVGLGHEVTSRMPGLDLMPSARGDRPLPDEPAFGAIYPNDATTLGEPARHVRGRWIRDGDFKLILGSRVNAGTFVREPLPLSLFDLRNDPGERVNLAVDPAHAGRVEALTRRLDEWWSP